MLNKDQKVYTTWSTRETDSISGARHSLFLWPPGQSSRSSQAVFLLTKTALSCRVSSTQSRVTEIHRDGTQTVDRSFRYSQQQPQRSTFCRQGLTPTDHAKMNRQAIKQMSSRNKEVKQSNQQNEAHKIRAISRPTVKTPVPSRHDTA